MTIDYCSIFLFKFKIPVPTLQQTLENILFSFVFHKLDNVAHKKQGVIFFAKYFSFRETTFTYFCIVAPFPSWLMEVKGANKGRENCSIRLIKIPFWCWQ